MVVTSQAMRQLAFALLAMLACAGRQIAPDPPGRPAISLAWRSALHRQHPLVGAVWDARNGRFVDEGSLRAAAAAARYLLLGEVHDNPDHHLLEEVLMRAASKVEPRPAAVFEMLDQDRQAAIDAALAAPDAGPDALARTVDWTHSGWPSFALYRPVFAAAFAARLPIVAAGLPRAVVGHLFHRGTSELPPRVREILDRAGAPPPEVLVELRQEMSAAHCGELPENMLDSLVLVQRARDALLAERLLAGGERAVLVAGSGHVRVDRGVPAYVRREAPGREVLAIAFVEVSDAGRSPADYASEFGEETLPFDLVVFTPAAEREDPCRGLREKMRSLRDHTAGGGTGSGFPARPSEPIEPRRALGSTRLNQRPSGGPSASGPSALRVS